MEQIHTINSNFLWFTRVIADIYSNVIFTWNNYHKESRQTVEAHIQLIN